MTSNWSRAFDEAAGMSHGVCPVCRPSRHGRVVLLTDEEEPEEERRCTRCGELVDEDGRCLGVLGPDGVVTLKHIVLVEEEELAN